MEIYSIKVKSSKNTNIFVLQTSKGEQNIHCDIIVKYALSVGEFDDEKFEYAKQESDQIVALNLAMKYLSSAMKTEKQIKDYLYKKEFKTKIILPVVQKLKEYNLLNDLNFANFYIKLNPNFSINKLRQKMFAFGVSKNIVDEVLQDFDDFESCQKSATKFLKNKIINQKTKEKLIRHLVSKGYNWNDIGKILNDLKFDENFCD